MFCVLGKNLTIKKCRFLKYEIQKNSFKSFGQNCGRPTNSQKNRICFLRQIIFINYFWVFTGNKNSRSSERLWRICGIFSLLLYFVCCKNATKFFLSKRRFCLCLVFGSAELHFFLRSEIHCCILRRKRKFPSLRRKKTLISIKILSLFFLVLLQQITILEHQQQL